MVRRGTARRLAVGVALVVVPLIAFAAGFVSAHLKTFPYGLFERVVGAGEDRSEPVPRGPDGSSDSGGDRRPGLWHLVREGGATGDPGARSAAEELADLPYLSGYEPAPDAVGVTVHVEEAAQPGLNLVVSGHAPEALLVDMAGRVLHRWSRELADVWPELAAERELGGFETFWRRAHVLPDGGLLAIWDGLGLVRLDRDSNVVWGHAGGEHHDLWVDPGGAIHVLTRKSRSDHPRLSLDGPIEEDFVTRLAADGRVLGEVSVLEALLDSDYAPLLAGARRRGDILHTNTIEVMDGRFAHLDRLYRAGNLLVSMPRLDTIAVIDPERRRVVWALNGPWRFQHQPTVLASGNLLIFDNTGHHGDSRVLEIEPLSQRIVWSWAGSPARRFTSYFLGSSQRLPNGNTLITESTAGRAFEVEPAGAIVWEYVNPHRAGGDRELIASLLEVVRIGRDELVEDFLAGLGAPGSDVEAAAP